MPALIGWWTQDVAQLASDPPAGEVASLGATLLGRWAEPHRRYHTTTHLVEMFWVIGDLEESREVDERDAALARVAAWFHDAVYDPRSRSGANEEASARLAGESLPRVRVDDGTTARVQALVRMTDGHDADDGSAVSHAFHDADLWILSAAPDRFDRYCEQVRAEYAHVPDDAYRTARAEILGGLARRDRLYHTGLAQREWDEAARANLKRELDRLRA